MMRLRQVAWSALAGGLCAGLLLYGLQSLWIAPLLQEAERLEQAAERLEQAAERHEQAAERLEQAAPRPPSPPHTKPLPSGAKPLPSGTKPLPSGAKPLPSGTKPLPSGAKPLPSGKPRLDASTLISFLGVGLGYALLLCAGFLLAGSRVGFARGLLWGVGGWIVVVLAPSWVVPITPPGMTAGDLDQRQLWWLMTAGLSAAGLWTLAQARMAWKPLGLIGLLAPPIGAAYMLPELAEGGVALAGRFAVSVLAVNAGFWVVLGAISGWVWERLAVQG